VSVGALGALCLDSNREGRAPRALYLAVGSSWGVIINFSAPSKGSHNSFPMLCQWRRVDSTDVSTSKRARWGETVQEESATRRCSMQAVAHRETKRMESFQVGVGYETSRLLSCTLSYLLSIATLYAFQKNLALSFGATSVTTQTGWPLLSPLGPNRDCSNRKTSHVSPQIRT
jgi:hypothetical protein